MNLNQVGRTQAFNQGTVGNPHMVASSLGQDSANFNDQVGKNFTPTSVLNQTVTSGNGMSQNDYNTRILSNGQELPSQNGDDETTQQGIARLLLDGMHTIGTL